MMRVTINGTAREVELESTVADVVAGFNLQPKHVAVEGKYDLVARGD